MSQAVALHHQRHENQSMSRITRASVEQLKRGFAEARLNGAASAALRYREIACAWAAELQNEPAADHSLLPDLLPIALAFPPGS
jgi:hypothetical protein